MGSLTATLAPQFVALAVIRGFLGLELPGYTVTFMLLLSLLAVQVTANLVNSYKDFERGFDTKETAGDRTLVDNLVSPRMLKALAVFSLVWWLAFLVWSVVATGLHPLVLSLAMLGTCLAIGYTAGPALKYLGLGDIAVFICFGPGVVAYSCVVLVGTFHWPVVDFVVPVTLYVIATLHANNYRDMDEDSRAGAKTVAIRLGPRASRVYYYCLLAGAHGGALAAGRHYGCSGAVATLAVLPHSIWLCVRINRRDTLRTQDEETAKSTMLFGVALALGILIMPGLELSSLGLGVTSLVVVVLKVFAN